MDNLELGLGDFDLARVYAFELDSIDGDLHHGRLCDLFEFDDCKVYIDRACLCEFCVDECIRDLDRARLYDSGVDDFKIIGGFDHEFRGIE